MMMNAVKSEWIKFRSVRANVVLIILAVGAPLVISILGASFGTFEGQTSSDVFSNVVLGPTFICGFLAGVLGVLGIGQEYRHNTMRVTLAAQPRRSTVLTAKVILNGLFGLYIGLVTPLLCFGFSGLILNARHVHMNLFEPRVNFIAFIGQGLFAGMVTLMGFGLGCIMRQPAGAIPTLLLWPLVAEGILTGLLGIWSDTAPKFLPFRAGFRLGITTDDNRELLARVPAGLYFFAWTVLIVGFGWWLAERRDA